MEIKNKRKQKSEKVTTLSNFHLLISPLTQVVELNEK